MVDVNAGIDVFKFTGPATGVYLIPVQAAPTVQFKGDFSHKIVVTLKGYGLNAYAKAKTRKGQAGLQEKFLKLLLSTGTLNGVSIVPGQ